MTYILEITVAMLVVLAIGAAVLNSGLATTVANKVEMPWNQVTSSGVTGPAGGAGGAGVADAGDGGGAGAAGGDGSGD